MIRTLLLAGVASVFLAQASAAQDKPDFRALYFNRLDQNKDGLVSLEDLQRIAAKEFKRIDEDRNGTLSLDEYLFGIPSERQDAIDFFTDRFERSDFNGDGQIDFNEDQAFNIDLVARADQNSDGLVSKDEFILASGD